MNTDDYEHWSSLIDLFGKQSAQLQQRNRTAGWASLGENKTGR